MTGGGRRREGARTRGACRSRMARVGLTLALALALTLAVWLPSAPAEARAAQVVSRDCAGGWIGWARYADDGTQVAMRMRPTARAWLAMGGGRTTGPLWHAYFACIGWRDGFARLSPAQWRSLWLQHRCHEYLGILGRPGVGATLDYESWVPDRGSLRRSLANGCH